jgi:hypothetical protein
MVFGLAIPQHNVAGPQRTCDPRSGADTMIAVVIVGSPVRLIDSGPEDYAALQPACRIAREQLPFHRRVPSSRAYSPQLNRVYNFGS